MFRIRNIFQLLGPRKLSLLKLFIRRDTPLKKTAIAVAVLLLAVSMVLPVGRSVNLSAGKCATIEGTLMADGSPIPPYPPTLVADGSPIPPYPAKAINECGDARCRWLTHPSVSAKTIFNERGQPRGRRIAHSAIPANLRGRRLTYSPVSAKGA